MNGDDNLVMENGGATQSPDAPARGRGRPRGSKNKFRFATLAPDMRDRLSRAGVKPLSAREILEALNDAELWRACVSLALEENDVRTVVDILKYLTDRRDGKARQDVNLTVERKISPDDISRAREVVRDLLLLHPMPALTDGSAVVIDAVPAETRS